jgi:hypothetical protein
MLAMGYDPATVHDARPKRLYVGAEVPMRVIRRFARQVANRFRPDKMAERIRAACHALLGIRQPKRK